MLPGLTIWQVGFDETLMALLPSIQQPLGLLAYPDCSNAKQDNTQSASNMRRKQDW
ncbi:hypothetical protein thsrh120_02060 [Rhizobium sp. No.120]